MKEASHPESTQRRPDEIRIFSGARLNPDGTFVSPAHQALSDLWTYEMDRRNLPGILRRQPTKVADEVHISLRVIPKTVADEPILEKIRNRLEKGVMIWVRAGSAPYQDIELFRKEFVEPLEQER